MSVYSQWQADRWPVFVQMHRYHDVAGMQVMGTPLLTVLFSYTDHWKRSARTGCDCLTAEIWDRFDILFFILRQPVASWSLSDVLWDTLYVLQWNIVWKGGKRMKHILWKIQLLPYSWGVRGNKKWASSLELLYIAYIWSRRLRWAGNVARMGEEEVHTEFGRETWGKEVTWTTQA